LLTGQRGHGPGRGSIALIAACSILAPGCAGDLSTLHPAGPGAAEIATLFWVMFAGAMFFTVLVGALFLVTLRRRRASPAERTHPAPRLWSHWLGIAMPLAVLVAVLVATIVIGERQFVRDDTLPVMRAYAEQWEWQFAQVDADGNEGPPSRQLELVAGQPTIIELVSEGVIHSFWVPRLAGKMDVVPGKVNRHLIQADNPGRYLGQCAEYCGVGHDFMRFEVIVRPAEAGQ
jgi:cytochrome c oxidase subunit II